MYIKAEPIKGVVDGVYNGAWDGYDLTIFVSEEEEVTVITAANSGKYQSVKVQVEHGLVKDVSFF